MMGILDSAARSAGDEKTPLLKALEAMEVRGRCASCHWWQKYPGAAYSGDARKASGECRRHSPLCSENEALLFPITHSSCWCGDYIAAGRSAADDQAQESSDG